MLFRSQRASQRDGQNEEQIKKIIAAQMPRAQKQQRADDIVLNDGHLDHLYLHLQPLHEKYLALAEKAASPADQFGLLQ